MAIIRIPDSTRDRVRELANQTGRPMQEIVVEALATYERKLFFEAMDRGYRELTDNEWAEERAEREMWDRTLGDGMENDQY